MSRELKLGDQVKFIEPRSLETTREILTVIKVNKNLIETVYTVERDWNDNDCYKDVFTGTGSQLELVKTLNEALKYVSHEIIEYAKKQDSITEPFLDKYNKLRRIKRECFLLEFMDMDLRDLKKERAWYIKFGHKESRCYRDAMSGACQWYMRGNPNVFYSDPDESREIDEYVEKRLLLK